MLVTGIVVELGLVVVGRYRHAGVPSLRREPGADLIRSCVTMYRR